MIILDLNPNPSNVRGKIVHLEKPFESTEIEQTWKNTWAYMNQIDIIETTGIVIPDKGTSTGNGSSLDLVAESPNSGPELEEALESLKEVFEECSEANWDGYNARPIPFATYLQAKKVIQSLPLSLPLPEIVPEPTGDIGLEWYAKEQFIFVISVGKNNIMTYGGIFGEWEEAHGTEYFSDSLSLAIIEHIQKLFRKSI
jgi:hypothetical protein